MGEKEINLSIEQVKAYIEEQKTIENGYANVVLEFNENGNINQCSCFHVDSGKNANTIPSTAVLQINEGYYIFEGISAPSSTPELGINAIEKLCTSGLCKWISSSFNSTEFNFSRFVKEILACDIHGGNLKFEKGDFLWEGQSFGKTTVVPTVLKRKDDKVILTINIRQRAGTLRTDVEKAFDEYRDQYQYKYKITEYLEPNESQSKLVTICHYGTDV